MEEGPTSAPPRDRGTRWPKPVRVTATLIQVRHGVKAHYHAWHEEIVYVISGKGVMTVGNEKRAIKAGDLIYLEKGAVHEVITKSAQPLVALSVMSPPFDGEDRIYTQ